jgi:hypothetical protein
MKRERHSLLDHLSQRISEAGSAHPGRWWRRQRGRAGRGINEVRLKGVSVLAATLLLGVVLATSVAGQQQAACAGRPAQGGGGRRGDAAPPTPQRRSRDIPQASWSSGAISQLRQSANGPDALHPVESLQARSAVGFRMTAIDGGTGETENTATMVVHINYMGQTIDVPTRWRGVGGFPAAEYPRQPRKCGRGCGSCRWMRNPGV